MESTHDFAVKSGFKVPVVALSLYAVASGYLMSLIPLMLNEYGIAASHASWLASVFYAGLLIGAVIIEPAVKYVGHRIAFVACLIVFVMTIVVLPLVPIAGVWMAARFVAGIAVAGVFVIVESWLLTGDETSRAKRLGLYMGSLYGGSALGQLGIGLVGVNGVAPFITILSMLSAAILVLLFIPTQQPQSAHSTPLTWRQMSKLNHAAIIGCIVSGLTLGSIYGLMPVELSHRNVSQGHLSALMALVILGGMAVQPIVPKLIHKVGRTPLMGMFCLVGVFGIGLVVLSNDLNVLAASLFLIGFSTFALYPIAINLGCDKLDENNIVSATQVMLFCYSVGSVIGPVIADGFMSGSQGLMTYLFATMMATAIYMIIASITTKKHMMAGE
ncbi:MFS transporter [Vibrio sp. 10N.286.49.C2]|uniref:MFS transporter n=1 Tax=unclassified Vibrio TaxID=2614977 RepID=UPI000C85DF26|nr:MULTISPECIES: MFS transporter [unclassified Vibrio]PMH42821.1 MFS transporter [Vibrio sp. 10N.286.49.C2]PMH53840.1 MFS transporter [Vibrio sp. 10N.286.49.B1]PMH81685.1 MFS transporter [Vibrio sp. 10N.286.48.B7]